MKQTRHKRRVRYRKNRVAELRNKGMSNKQISLILGVSERTVYRIASNQNAVVFFSEGRGFSTEATKNMALKILRVAGLSLQETAWLFGRSPHTIARWRREVSREKIL